MSTRSVDMLKWLWAKLKCERGIFGLFESDPVQFTLPDKEARAKINQFQEFGSSDVTGPSQAGQISLDELDRQRNKALEQASQSAQRGQATSLSNLGLFGGAGGGAGERLSRQSQQGLQRGNQQLFSDFTGQRSQVLGQDLASEQARRDRAKEQALQGELGILGARTSAELGRAGIAAQNKAQRGKGLQAIGTLAGFGLGGPGGAALGGTIGGLFG